MECSAAECIENYKFQITTVGLETVRLSAAFSVTSIFANFHLLLLHRPLLEKQLGKVEFFENIEKKNQVGLGICEIHLDKQS